MRTAPLRLLALTAVLALASTGCSSSSDDGARPGGPTSTTAFPTPEGPEVTSTGAEPRRELRLALRPGTTTVTYTTDLAVLQESEGTTRSLDPPPVAQTIAYTVGAVDDDGADVTFAVTEVAVEAEGTATTPEAALLLAGDLAGLRGTTGTGHLSTRGHLERIDVELPAGVGEAVVAQVDALTEQLGALAPTLPEEAVGVGATWVATTEATVGGVRTTQETTYTLTAVTGDEVSYTSATTYATEAQDVALDELPTGATARLVSSDVAGTAEGTMDLGSPAHTLTATAAGSQVIDLVQGSAPAVRLSQRVDVATSVRAG